MRRGACTSYSRPMSATSAFLPAQVVPSATASSMALQVKACSCAGDSELKQLCCRWFVCCWRQLFRSLHHICCRVCRSDARQLEPLRHAFQRAETFRERGADGKAGSSGGPLRMPE